MKKVLTLMAVLWVSAHLIAQPHHAKLSPRLGALVARMQAEGPHRAPAIGAAETGTVEAFLLLQDGTDEAALCAQYGLSISTRIGRVLIGQIPVGSLVAMTSDERIVRMEAERAPRPLLDVLPQQIAADRAWSDGSAQLPQAFTGKGIVVGIVDVGFDYTHPMFTDRNGATRIRWAGDYISQPTHIMTDTTEILHTMFSPDPYECHGTHVAGIAAGKRVTRTFDDKAFQGVAHEADIAMGAISLTGNNPILNSEAPTSAAVLRAMSDIYAFADNQGKPCVINFSAGITQTFAHNRTLEEEAIRTLVSQPGHVLVVAAGNAGLYSYLAHKEATMERGGAGIRFHTEDSYGAYFGVEVRMQPSQVLSISYMNQAYSTTHGTITLTPAELQSATNGVVTKVIGSGIYRKTLTAQFTEQAEDGSAIIYVACDDSTFPETDRLLLTVEGEGDAWFYADVLCAPLENVAAMEGHSLTQEGYTVAWPGTMDEVITVGNIGWRYTLRGTYGTSIDVSPWELGKGEGYLARSSSCGPTLDGRMKPDVCAPGVNVISAMSNGLGYGLPQSTSDALEQQYQYEYMGIVDVGLRSDFNENNPDHLWNMYYYLLAQTGTSMSAPAVAGTIALWLQADPTLTTARIKDLLAHTSRQPDATLTYPNNQYGHGEINAYQGLLRLLDPTGLWPVTRHQPAMATLSLQGKLLTVRWATGEEQQAATTAVVRIYAPDGRLLLTHSASSAIDLSALPHGVYAVQLSTGRAQTTGSTLIRL